MGVCWDSGMGEHHGSTQEVSGSSGGTAQGAEAALTATSTSQRGVTIPLHPKRSPWVTKMMYLDSRDSGEDSPCSRYSLGIGEMTVALLDRDSLYLWACPATLSVIPQAQNLENTANWVTSSQSLSSNPSCLYHATYQGS